MPVYFLKLHLFAVVYCSPVVGERDGTSEGVTYAQTDVSGQNSVACHSDDRKNLIKSRLALRCSTVAFNLYAVFFYSFSSLSLLYFGSPKVPKGSAQTKIVAYSSARELNLFNIPCSSFACHFNPICFEQGAAKLAPRGCIRKITPTLRSNSLAQWPALNRDLHSIFDSAVLFNITFAGGKPQIKVFF